MRWRNLLAAVAMLGSIAWGCGDRDEVVARDAFRTRGVIEGFYGPPYAHAERLDLLRFLGERGMNAYFYAPKNDPLHRDRWRDPYPPEALREFGELAAAGDAHGVRFTFAISPGLTYDPADPADFERLADKLRSLAGVGVRGFSLLFDDLFAPGAAALDPDVQADLAARTERVVREIAPDATFSLIGNVYAGSAQELLDGTGFLAALSPVPPLAYYDAYARTVPAEIPVLWTGPGVFTSHLGLAGARAFGEIARRPVIVWDNFPVNDTLPLDLFLGPYLGRDRDLAEGLEGFVLNLMSQPRAGRIAVATAAEYLRDPARYDPELAWERAVDDVGGAARGPLRRFASWNRGHPVLEGASEAVDLVRALARASADAADLEPLRRELAGLEAAPAELERELRDRELLAEIRPWLAKAGLLARAGLLGLEAASGSTSCVAYREARARAQALPEHVGVEIVGPSLPLLAGGFAGNPSDPVGELFAAIDRRLAAVPGPGCSAP